MTAGMEQGASERRKAFVDRQMQAFREQTEAARRAREETERAAQATDNLDRKSSAAASGGTRRLTTQLVSLATRAASVHPLLGRIVTTIGSFAAGSLLMGGVLAGLTLLIGLIERMADRAGEAGRKLDAARDSARRLILERQTAGDIDLIEEMDPIGRARDRVNRQLTQAREVVAGTRDAAGVPLGVWEKTVAKLEKEFEELTQEYDELDTRLSERRTRRKKDEADELLRIDREMYGESRKLLEGWRRDQLTAIERQIEDLQRLEAAAKKLGDVDAAAAIRKQRDDLQQSVADMQQMSAAVDQLMQNFQPGLIQGGGFRDQRQFRVSGMTAVEAVAAYRDAVRDAKLAFAEGAITEEQFHARVAAASDHARTRLLAYLRHMRDLGLITPEILDAIAAGLDQVSTKTDGARAAVGEYAAMFGALGRGILGALDAVNALDDGTRQLLTGLLDVASALDQIDRASKLDGFAKTIGMIGGIGALVGGVLGLGATVLGPSAEEREARELMRRNTEALEDLALEISNFKITTDVLERFLALDQPKIDPGKQEFFNIPGTRYTPGFSAAELRALEHELGIQILDSNGRMIPGAIAAAQQAIRMRQQQPGGLFGGAGSVPPQERLSVSMTVVQGNRMIDILASSNDHLRALRDGLVSGARANIPAPATATGGDSFIVENLTVDVQLAGAPSREEAFAVGQSIGSGIHDRLGAAWRAAGKNGFMRLQYREDN